MGSACGESYLHIGDRRASQHAKMGFLAQMHENEPLPVAVEVVLTDLCSENKTFATLERLKNEMYLGIVAQRLIMANALDCVFDGLFIHNLAGADADIKVKAFFYDAL